MPPSESQLETWQNLPRTQTAVQAHEEVRRAVLGAKLWLAPPDIYLQGSYANDVCTTKDRDVDIICQIHKDSLFTFDINSLPQNEQDHFRQVVGPATADLQTFKAEILGILYRNFGYAAVEVGNKAIRVLGTPGIKLNADVVICNQYRRYQSFNGDLDTAFIEGIVFFDGRGNRIINYPRLHKANGISKHAETGGWYKPTVRVLKNARSHLVEIGRLADGVAPSYFIQGLLYNVAPVAFGGTRQQNFMDVIKWLVDNYGLWPNFYCQNGIDRLFGVTEQQWKTSDALTFLSALIDLE